jgi:hypothetical protein
MFTEGQLYLCCSRFLNKEREKPQKEKALLELEITLEGRSIKERLRRQEKGGW